MALIRPSTHRVLDFLTVVAFAVAPLVLSLSGLAAWLAWILAGVHLVMTLVTAFPGGAARPVPLRAHGAVELCVGVVLIVLPLVIGWGGAARWFYVVAGVVILIVRVVSQYDANESSGGAA